MKVSCRSFLAGSAAPFFIGGCATKVAPRKIGPKAEAANAMLDTTYHNGWELGG